MNISSKFLLLENLKVLKSLSIEDKNALSLVSEVRTYKKDELIFRTGDQINSVYILDKGSVFIGRNSVANKPILKDIIFEDAIFGENVFATNNQRTDFAKAVNDVRLFKVPVKHFEQLFKQNGAFSVEITYTMISRLENLENRIKNFVFLKAKERIGSFLHKSALQNGIKIGIDEVLVNLGLSHRELASITDTSRQTVARVLGDFKKSNIIHFSERKPGKILVRDLNALAF